MGSLKGKKGGEGRGKFHTEFSLSRHTGPEGQLFTTSDFFLLSIWGPAFLIEPLKKKKENLNYRSAASGYPHHFHLKQVLISSHLLVPNALSFNFFLLPFFQDHQASQEQDPQVLVAPLGFVALQVARVLLESGDHQDPLDTATLLSVLVFLTTDKDTQVEISRV